MDGIYWGWPSKRSCKRCVLITAQLGSLAHSQNFGVKKTTNRLNCIFVCLQPDSTTLFALPPPNTSRRWYAQGQARDRDLRAVLGNLQDKRHIRQTYSGRSVSCNETRKSVMLPRPTNQSSEKIVTSLPWFG